MALREFLLPWDNQPQGPADLDPHWIARGLSFLSLGNGLYWSRNTDWRGASTLTGGPRRLGGKYDLSSGLGSTFGGGTTDRISTGILLPYSTGFRSIVSFRYANTTGGGGFGRIFNPAGSSGVAANDEALFPNGATNGMEYSKSGTTPWQWAATTPIVTGVWACDGVTHDQRSTGVTPTMYLNGLSVAVSFIVGGSGSYPTTGGLTIDLGNRSTDSARGWDGILGPLAIFDHASAGLTDQEHGALASNPWQLFAPRSIWVPVSVGGGSASTITAAAGVATASALAASSTAASTPTAAAGTATASTVAASSTAASAITSATGAATASTLTGSAVVAGAITAAAGVATGETLAGTTLAAGSAAIVAAGGVATTATLGGSSVAAADIGVAAGAATASVMGGPGAEPVARLFAGGFPRREQLRKGYIIKGVRYWLTEEELAVMVAQMLAEISRGDIKQVTAGKPKTISKKTWDAIQVEARIEAVAKQFDDTDEDEDESILMML